MAGITDNLPPIPPNTDPDLARWLEESVSGLRREIYLLRQFLEPAIKSAENTPDYIFDPLEQ